MNREDFLHWLGTDTGRAAIAGALGGVVRWVTLRERPLDGIASLIVGSICALYLGPLVDPVLEPIIGKIARDGDSVGFTSFVVGLGGISLAAFVIEIFRAKQKGREHDQA